MERKEMARLPPHRRSPCQPIFYGRERELNRYKGCTKKEGKNCRKGIDIRALRMYYRQAVAHDGPREKAKNRT